MGGLFNRVDNSNELASGVRHREIFRRDTISRYQSSKFGIWIRYLDVSYHVISLDTGYDITIYRDISCDIWPDHPETPDKHNFNENPPPRCGLLWLIRSNICSCFFVSALFTACLPSGLFRCPYVAMSISWTHHRTDRTTSKQQPCPIRTRPAPRSHVYASFCFLPCVLFSLSLSFFLSWCLILLTSSYEVPKVPGI